MLRHGYNPEYMLEAIISSIPKNAKESIQCSENYRGIALCSALSKVFDHIMIQRFSDKLMSSDMQFSFKAQHSTVMCTCAVKEIAAHYNEKGSNVYVCMLDASKAFDKVNFVKSFSLLIDRNIPGVFLRIIMDLYTRQNLRASWNGVKSTNLSASNGVRQGGVLSPILFNVYIDELLLRLKQHDFGCHIGNRFVGGLCYADDLTILSPSVRGLQKIVGIYEEFAKDYSITFNSGKTLYMCLGRMPEYPQPQIYLNGMTLQWVKNARHLGNIVTSQLKDDMDIQLKRGQFYGAVNILCAKFRGILQDINVASKLFYSYCCSFYGCQLWDLSSNYIEDIYVAWQKAIRRIFNLPCNTHRYLLPFIAGSLHIRVNLVNRFNNFFNALMYSDNKIIELLVYNCHFSNTPLGLNRKSPLGLNRKFMNMYNCYKCNEVEEAHGALLLSLLNV